MAAETPALRPPEQTITALIPDEAAILEVEYMNKNSDRAESSTILPTIGPPDSLKASPVNLVESRLDAAERAADIQASTAIAIQPLDESRATRPVSTSTSSGNKSEMRIPEVLAGVSLTISMPPIQANGALPWAPQQQPRLQSPAELTSDAPADTLEDNSAKDKWLTYHHGATNHDDLLATAIKMMTERKRGLPERSVHSDLIRFRWPLASFVVVALHTPYAQVAFSLLTWCLFLPFFVSELREWH